MSEERKIMLNTPPEKLSLDDSNFFNNRMNDYREEMGLIDAIHEEASDLDTTVLHEAGPAGRNVLDHLAEFNRKLESVEKSSKRISLISNLSLLISLSTLAFFVYKQQHP
ncbi:Oidioi.mRNA.OKI2018_I69.XSR.g16292.t1.cds [Oikopleura dioica]|uniref:Oidioi.mRNA.OKI2018_I69.XSR.g16292.t1.cds n=1 Tax=Oikopleura dioica TaxID=34765 RepID=A0ABN7SFM2_OIKDI|nr:Oidioi.mRNA.OKI2018_I69.XSR.g16292.t1.cds [Oikopleura dioica]